MLAEDVGNFIQFFRHDFHLSSFFVLSNIDEQYLISFELLEFRSLLWITYSDSSPHFLTPKKFVFWISIHEKFFRVYVLHFFFVYANRSVTFFTRKIISWYMFSLHFSYYPSIFMYFVIFRQIIILHENCFRDMYFFFCVYIEFCILFAFLCTYPIFRVSYCWNCYVCA